MEKLTNDVLDLGSIIKEALPKAMVSYCDNFDDYYHGWDICPQPGVLIRLCVEMNDCMRIRLTKYEIATFDGTCRMRQMYFGTIPPTKKMEPDFDFVMQLFKNWHSVG